MPTDPIDAFVLLCAFVGVFGLPMLGLLAIAEWAVVRYNKRRRLDNRPRPERDPLGDDWRDSVAHLFPTTTNERRETQ